MKYAANEVQTRFGKGNVSEETHKKCEGTQWGKDAQMEWPEDMARNEAEKVSEKKHLWRECLISPQNKNIYHRCDKYYLGLLNMELT